MPEVGFLRSYARRGLRAVRVWPVPRFRRFLIFYRVTEKTVEVVRVLHSARDVARVLGPRGGRSHRPLRRGERRRGRRGTLAFCDGRAPRPFMSGAES